MPDASNSMNTQPAQGAGRQGHDDVDPDVTIASGSAARSMSGSDAPTLATAVGSSPSTRAASAAAAEGKTYGDYVLLEPIGQGGMGTVYKARHRHMDRIVALKLISASLMTSDAMVQRFYREIKVAAKLIHPNIVTAFDASEQNGEYYLVMEYVKGKDLASVIRKYGPMPIGKAVEFVLAAAHGLAYAHKRGIVHRDIKPANILLAADGSIKLLDMGLARLSEGESGVDDLTLTTPGELMGTVAYMAPEHAANPKNADERSDIYSLGCTLYQMLTGTSPYCGTTAVEVIVASREQPTPDVRAMYPAADAATADALDRLQNVLELLLAKRPEQRYQSMQDVIADLERLQEVLPASLHKVRAKPGQADERNASTGSSVADFDALAALAAQAHDEGPRSAFAAPTIALPTTASVSVAPPPTPKKRGLLIGVGVAAVLAIAVGVTCIIVFSGGDHQSPSAPTNQRPLAVAPTSPTAAPSASNASTALTPPTAPSGNADGGVNALAPDADRLALAPTQPSVPAVGTTDDASTSSAKTPAPKDDAPAAPAPVDPPAPTQTSPTPTLPVAPSLPDDLPPGDNATPTAPQPTPPLDANPPTPAPGEPPREPSVTEPPQRRPDGPGADDPQRPDPNGPPQPRANDAPQPAGPAMDLMEQVRVTPQTLRRGFWKLSDGVLTSRASAASTLAIPYSLPPAYRLEVTFSTKQSRPRPDGLLAVDMSIALLRGRLQIDEAARGGPVTTFSATSLPDEREARRRPAPPVFHEVSRREGPLIQADHEHHLVIESLRDEITITLDGQQIVSWRGNVPPPGPTGPRVSLEEQDNRYVVLTAGDAVEVSALRLVTLENGRDNEGPPAPGAGGQGPGGQGPDRRGPQPPQRPNR